MACSCRQTSSLKRASVTAVGSLNTATNEVSSPARTVGPKRSRSPLQAEGGALAAEPVVQVELVRTSADHRPGAETGVPGAAGEPFEGVAHEPLDGAVRWSSRVPKL